LLITVLFLLEWQIIAHGKFIFPLLRISLFDDGRAVVDENLEVLSNLLEDDDDEFCERWYLSLLSLIYLLLLFPLLLQLTTPIALAFWLVLVALVVDDPFLF
jgi:hypothetical protein